MRSKRLVVDASVVQACVDERSEHPRSKNCRHFLLRIYTICHRVVLTEKIKEEWDRHTKGYARKWRSWMVAGKKLLRLEVPLRSDLEERVVSEFPEGNIREAVLKDLPLIEAALSTDLTIVSLDETAREHFRTLAARVGEFRNLVWVNPERIEEDPITWLQKGAKPERQKRFG